MHRLSRSTTSPDRTVQAVVTVLLKLIVDMFGAYIKPGAIKCSVQLMYLATSS